MIERIVDCVEMIVEKIRFVLLLLAFVMHLTVILDVFLTMIANTLMKTKIIVEHAAIDVETTLIALLVRVSVMKDLETVIFSTQQTDAKQTSTKIKTIVGRATIHVEITLIALLVLVSVMMDLMIASIKETETAKHTPMEIETTVEDVETNAMLKKCVRMENVFVLLLRAIVMKTEVVKPTLKLIAITAVFVEISVVLDKTVLVDHVLVDVRLDLLIATMMEAAKQTSIQIPFIVDDATLLVVD